MPSTVVGSWDLSGWIQVDAGVAVAGHKVACIGRGPEQGHSGMGLEVVGVVGKAACAALVEAGDNRGWVQAACSWDRDLLVVAAFLGIWGWVQELVQAQDQVDSGRLC